MGNHYTVVVKTYDVNVRTDVITQGIRNYDINCNLK